MREFTRVTLPALAPIFGITFGVVLAYSRSKPQNLKKAKILARLESVANVLGIGAVVITLLFIALGALVIYFGRPEF